MDKKYLKVFFSKAGYQITQQRNPIARKGQLEFIVYNPSVHKKPYYKRCKITQLQLEQDSGKSLHDLKDEKLV